MDKPFVRQKIMSLVQYLDELEPLARCTLEEYQADYVKRHADGEVDRTCRGARDRYQSPLVESAGMAAPLTYHGTFEEAARLKVISRSLATRLATTTGLRNRLVHGYENVDNVIVYRALKPLIRNYRKYVASLEGYLRRVQ